MSPAANTPAMARAAPKKASVPKGDFSKIRGPATRVPTSAAAGSPRARKNRAATATGLSNTRKATSADTAMYVAPVSLRPSDSLSNSLSLGTRYWFSPGLASLSPSTASARPDSTESSTTMNAPDP